MENKYKSQCKYIKNNIKQFKIDLNKNTDKDIINFLDSKENKVGYIKKLIRNDMINYENKKIDN